MHNGFRKKGLNSSCKYNIVNTLFNFEDKFSEEKVSRF